MEAGMTDLCLLLLNTCQSSCWGTSYVEDKQSSLSVPLPRS